MSHSEWEFFGRVRTAMLLNPPHVVGSIDAALDLVLDGGFIYPTEEDSNVLLHARERCGLSYYTNSTESHHNLLPPTIT